MNSISRNPHRNCFDLMRHVAALSVLFSHHFAISGRLEPGVGGLFSVGGFAVVVFFSISGYLVSKSYCRCNDFLDFLSRRSLRIFPAYIACCFLMIYLLGFAYSDSNLLNFLGKKENFDMFLSYSVFVYPTVPNVFEGYHLSQAINGSLWTLSVEFICYLLLGGLLSISRTFKPLLIAIALLLASYVLLESNKSIMMIWFVPAYLVTSFAVSFFVGALLGMTEEKWKSTNTKLWLGAAAAILLYVTNGKPDALIISHLLIPVIVIFVGSSISEMVIAGKYDISYGIYIYAFPVQQIMVNATPLGFWSSMIASFAVTISLAIASWHLVEKPSIQLSKRSIVRLSADAKTPAAM